MIKKEQIEIINKRCVILSTICPTSPVAKRLSRLLKKDVKFSESFEENKKILGNKSLPSKKIRNQTAGLLGKTKKAEKIKKADLEI